MDRAPYHAAAFLAGRAVAEFGYLDGALTATGVDFLTLPLWRQLNVVFARVVDAIDDPKRRAALIEKLDWPIPPEEWGEGVEAVDAQERASQFDVE